MRSPYISSLFCNTGLWTKNVSCHFSKPRMLQLYSHQLLEPPASAPWGDFRMKKDRILSLDSEGEYRRNNFSEPRLLHLHIHWKVLNSLTWDSWFSLITIIFWCSDYLLFDAKLLYNLSHPQISYLRVTWDAVSWTWSPKITHWIKHISQLSGCT